MVSTQHVFISYSRKDYYFAESLAFDFVKRGIDAWLDAKDLAPGADWLQHIEVAIDEASCLILVVSPDSLKSATVRREFQRAFNQGKRIIALLFRQNTVPAEWGAVEIVDFRGDFEAALDELTARLASTSAGVAEGKQKARCSALRFPPWVSVTALCVLWPLLLVFSIWWVYPEFFFDVVASTQSYNEQTDGPVLRFALGESGYHTFYWSLFAVMFGLIVHYGILEFLYRRMSMTRLALVFAFFLYTVGYALLQHVLGPRIPTLSPGFITRGLQNAWPTSLWVLLSAITTSGLGLGIVLFKRPGDLLRWTPTGYAWPSYRREYFPGPMLTEIDAYYSLDTIKRFSLLYDIRDKPLADRLRHLLRSAGAAETSDGGQDVTAILLLTNCSRIGWVERQVQAARGKPLTLLATNLSPPESLDWLWRFHWIDFRTWETDRLVYQQNGLPFIPETLLQPRFPATISLTHHGLCALSALIWQVPNLVLPPTYSGLTIPLAGSLGFGITNVMLCWAVPLVWVVPARKLLRRTCSAASFLGSIAACFIVTGLAAWRKLREFPDVTDSPRLIAAALVLAAMALWILLKRREFAHWFPLPTTPGERQAPDLTPSKNRKTLLWFSVYWFIWVQLFSQGQFAAF